MQDYKLRQIDLEEYQDLFRQSVEPQLLQSPEWAKLKEGWQAERFVLEASLPGHKTTELAIGQVLYRSIVGRLKLAYLAFGPCLLPQGKPEDRLIFYRELKAKLKLAGSCFMLKVQPPDLRKLFQLDGQEPDDDPDQDQAYLCPMQELGFKHQGFSRRLDSTVQPRYQAVIYRADWPEKPFSKLRYNLRQLERREVRIERSGAERLPEFMHCLACTEARQEISLRNQAYFQYLMDLYMDRARLHLAVFNIPEGRAKAEAGLAKIERELAELKDNQVKKGRQLEEQLASARKMVEFFNGLESDTEVTIGGALVIHLGQVSEMPYAGNDDQYFELPAAWGIYNSVIEEAFAGGADKLNLGGVDGHFNDGLSRFKSHFSPRVEENYGEFDLELKPLISRLFRLALSLRKWIHHLRRGR